MLRKTFHRISLVMHPGKVHQDDIRELMRAFECFKIIKDAYDRAELIAEYASDCNDEKWTGTSIFLGL